MSIGYGSPFMRCVADDRSVTIGAASTPLTPVIVITALPCELDAVVRRRRRDRGDDVPGWTALVVGQRLHRRRSPACARRSRTTGLMLL